jgi:hypothetical protein
VQWGCDDTTYIQQADVVISFSVSFVIDNDDDDKNKQDGDMVACTLSSIASLCLISTDTHVHGCWTGYNNIQRSDAAATKQLHT